MSVEQPGDARHSPESRELPVTVGSLMAGYRLEEQIGSGRMAVVFRAVDERMGRQVALKILASWPAEDAPRQWFIRESRATAAVQHPSLIPVYEVGEASGLLFIAMRYVHGEDAGSVLARERSLAPERVAVIVSAVASALDTLHSAGLAHRDVRPANILLESISGPAPHVYLTGFGLAEGAAPIRRTLPSQLGPAAAYLAPELIMGQQPDGRSDEYALACTAVELLTGSPPFGRSHQVIRAHMSEPAPSLTSLRPALGQEADPVLARALAKEPAHRYPSCREFARALSRALGIRRPDSGPPPPSPSPPGVAGAMSTDSRHEAVATGQHERPVSLGSSVIHPPDAGPEAEAPVQFLGSPGQIAALAQPGQPEPGHGATSRENWWARRTRGRETDARSAEPGKTQPEPEKTQPPGRFLIAHLPASVPLRSDVSLTVRVGVREADGADARSAALPALVVGAGGARVTVVVQAPRALVPIGELERVILVPESGDSQPVRFAFRTRGVGLHRVVVTAWAGGTFLGELALQVSVQDGATFVDAPDRLAPVTAIRAEPGEVTLQVRFDGQRYTFQLLSGATLFEPVLAETLAGQPGQAVERTIDTLRRMAAGSSGYTAANTRRWMTEAGIGLWNEMVPELIKDQFWQLRDAIGSFSIAAGQDVVPWELLYPLSPGHDEGFLVEQFPVLRRVYGQQSGRLTLGGARYVVPAGSPGNAQDEIARIKEVLAQTLGGAQDIADLGVLMSLIDSGNIGLLHFACHNTFRAEAGGSVIAMGGGPFVPGLLNRAVTLKTLASRHPLVFINACRSAGVVPEYTQMMGWAQQFMAAGAGAFVGTLWAVRSESASSFATAFYQVLTAGGSLGEASRAARAKAAGDSADPTWLAYTVYGDPAAKAISN